MVALEFYWTSDECAPRRMVGDPLTWDSVPPGMTGHDRESRGGGGAWRPRPELLKFHWRSAVGG